MQEDSDSEYSTPEGDEYSFSVSDRAPGDLLIERIDSTTPPNLQQNIVSGLDENPLERKMQEEKEPLLIRVVRDDELSKFERKTVWAAWCGIGVAILSLFAACYAGYWVGQQFEQMKAQTKILNESFVKQQEDSTASSVTTAKELAALQTQIIAAQNSTKALQGQLNIASKQFEINQQLIASQGASITLSNYTAIAPLVFHENGEINANIEVSLNNVGGLAATKVSVRSQPYYSLWGENIFREPQQRQRDFCSKPATINTADLIDTSQTILPHTSQQYQINFGFRKPEQSELIEWPPKGTADQLPKKSVIFLIVVGCVDYQSGLMSGSHQTGFIFWIQKGSGPNGNAPSPIPYGVDVLKEQIIVTPNFFGQGKSH